MAEEKVPHQVPSLHSSVTAEETLPSKNDAPGFEESALPEDRELEDQRNKVDSDWDHDPANGRNWSPARKWTAAGFVRCLIYQR